MIAIIIFMLIYMILSKILLAAAGDNIDTDIKAVDGVIEIRISNRTKWPIARCCVRISAENLITGVKDAEAVSAGMMPGKSVTAAFDIKDRNCGCIRIRYDRIEITDLIGILRKKVKCQDEYDCYIMPELRKLELGEKAAEHYNMESFKYSYYKPGNDSGDTFGIEEYRKGNSIKAIHWKLSAKTGKVMVRQYGLPVDSRIMVISEKQDRKKQLDPEKRSRITEYTLSLSYTLAALGLSHYLGWYDAASKEFKARLIENEDSLHSCAREFLASPVYEEGADAAEEFIKADVFYDFSGFILVSYFDKGMEKLFKYGETFLYTP